MEKDRFGSKKIEKLIRWVGGTFRDSGVGTRFCLKMALLDLKKNKNYHRIQHIQINLDSNFSVNKQFWFLEQIPKKSILPVENVKKVNIAIEFFIFELV